MISLLLRGESVVVSYAQKNRKGPHRSGRDARSCCDILGGDRPLDEGGKNLGIDGKGRVDGVKGSHSHIERQGDGAGISRIGRKAVEGWSDVGGQVRNDAPGGIARVDKGNGGPGRQRKGRQPVKAHAGSKGHVADRKPETQMRRHLGAPSQMKIEPRVFKVLEALGGDRGSIDGAADGAGEDGRHTSVKGEALPGERAAVCGQGWGGAEKEGQKDKEDPEASFVRTNLFSRHCLKFRGGIHGRHFPRPAEECQTRPVFLPAT